MTEFSGSMNFLIIFPNGKKKERSLWPHKPKQAYATPFTDMIREELSKISQIGLNNLLG